MDLTELSAGVHKRRLKKRVGRGIGSGHGKTSSRGHKGQYASAGAGLPGALFAGGQTPIHRRLPKRGFSNARFAKEYAVVNVGDLDRFDDGTTVDLAKLKEARLVVGTYDGVRVLGEGELTKKLVVSATHFSKTAKGKIEGKGGTATVLEGPKKPVRNKMKPKVKKDKPAPAA
jgi:large subunit ribosomal protein L15